MTEKITFVAFLIIKPLMMKYLKISGILLLVIIALVTILSMVLPVKQRIIKIIIINAPVSAVYDQLVKFEYLNKWAVWNLRDSTIQLNFSGTDGKVGAAATWTGDPEVSGNGRIVIGSLLPGKKIVHNLSFTRPKKGNAESEFMLEEVNGATRLTWEFDFDTPRPSNIFNLFYSMEKKMGKDFEEGLKNIKLAIEKVPAAGVSKNYDVMSMNFPSTSFAVVRQVINKADMAAFFSQHFPMIVEECQKINASPGTPSGFYYNWNDNNEQADIAAAIPVIKGSKFDNMAIRVVDIPGSKAVFVNYYGAYENMAAAHNSIKNYLANNKMKIKQPAIEQYISDPGKETDSARWLTKIIYLVE